MSERYPGGVISQTPVTPTPSSAPGVWTLDQQAQAQKAGTWPFGGPFNYIEDVFSTYLYTGNGSTQTITNGIDLSGKGGLVWLKRRDASGNNWVGDTVRGRSKLLITNSTGAEQTSTAGNDITSFNSDGFSLGPEWVAPINTSGATYASWTFRKQPKFFDVVTYTGTGSNRTVDHNLGSVPGCIITKKTNSTSNWAVYHVGMGNTNAMLLNSTLDSSNFTGAGWWNNTNPTSTQFTLGNDLNVNANGDTYVAYLFAHNAGGFGLTGTDNVISCGSFTTDAGGSATVTLGYEPQWLLVKCTSNTDNWDLMDTMRGWNMTTTDATLYANLSNAESTANWGNPTATGFDASFGASRTYIYIAIRRGPMKTPTSGTSVFEPTTYSGDDTASRSITAGSLPYVDTVINQGRTSTGHYIEDRLRGLVYLITNTTGSEAASRVYFDLQAAVKQGDGTSAWFNAVGTNYVNYNFRRAPGFFDVVCYTGNGPGTQVVSHNLGVVPELVINKGRSVSGVNGGWTVFQGSTTSLTGFLRLNTDSAQSGDTLTVSSTSFTADSTIGFGMNTSGATYVTYLFASCPGVSKVGRFTGTGATQTIDCGFTGGARWVMIKRLDSTGDWYVWDTARGMVSGTDPSLLLNSTAAEVNANSVYTTSVGFQIVSTAAGINASGGSYIYLAIA